MNTIRCCTLASAGFVALLAVASAAVQSAAPPSHLDAATLLRKALDARDHLGPVIIRGKMMSVVPKSNIALGVSFTRMQNDPSHYFETNRMVGEGIRITESGKDALIEMRYYRNGGDVMIFHGADSTYTVEPPGDPERSDVALAYFAAGLADKKRTAEWGKLTSTAEKIDSDDIYSFVLRDVRLGDAAKDVREVRVAVAKVNGLIRRLVLLDKKGGGLSYTWTYEQQAKPFSSDTFMFVAPPGATLRPRK